MSFGQTNDGSAWWLIDRRVASDVEESDIYLNALAKRSKATMALWFGPVSAAAVLAIFTGFQKA